MHILEFDVSMVRFGLCMEQSSAWTGPSQIAHVMNFPGRLHTTQAKSGNRNVDDSSYWHSRSSKTVSGTMTRTET